MAQVLAQYDDGKLVVLAGTYRIGFGQKLTLAPPGCRPRRRAPPICSSTTGGTCRPCAASRRVSSRTRLRDTDDRFGIGDLTVREGFRGVALGARGSTSDPGGSSFGRSARCRPARSTSTSSTGPIAATPGADELEECKSPRIFATQENPSDPSSTFNYTTLPRMWNELLGGAHGSFYWGARQKIGVTGYGAKAVWLPRGIELDFQESASTPGGGCYGAIGADLAYGWEWLDVYAEVARSFDDEPGGAGGEYGAWRGRPELGALRARAHRTIYDEGSATLRPPNEQATTRGNRARDEAGGG